MKILITTTLPLMRPSAGLTRLKRMRRGLSVAGMQSIIIGAGDGVEAVVQQGFDEEGEYIMFPTDSGRRWRTLFRAMHAGTIAATFYRSHIASLLTKLECDCVIDYTTQAQVSSVVVDQAHRNGIPVIGDCVERYAINAYNLANGMNLQQFLLRARVIPRMDGVIGISHGWCKWASARAIPNVWIPAFAHDTGSHRIRPNENKGRIKIVFVGHWSRREVPLALLEAVVTSVRRGIDIRVDVLGNVGTRFKERRAMKVWRNNPVLQERVRFLGFVSDVDRDRILAESDAFILLREDTIESEMLFPTRLPEYLLSGNPVILSKVASFKECFEHKRDIWFVPSTNSPADIAEALGVLAADPIERFALGQRGRAKALKEFSEEVLGCRLAVFLEARVKASSLPKQ